MIRTPASVESSLRGMSVATANVKEVNPQAQLVPSALLHPLPILYAHQKCVLCAQLGVASLGVPVPIAANELPDLKLLHDVKADLQFTSLDLAVLFVVRESVESVVQVPENALTPIKGAPGVATLVGEKLLHFGSSLDCANAAGGCIVQAGLVILARRAHIMDLALCCPSQRASRFKTIVATLQPNLP
jgi:hypothetical protein